MKPLPALALAGAFLLAGCNAEEAGNTGKTTIALAGDSHCVGLAQLTGFKSVARVGAGTREVLSQLGRLPEGITVIVCAGTNDAPNRFNGFQATVDAVLAEAGRRNQKLIWVGPINTPLWWDKYSAQADEYLKTKLPHYVSMRQAWKHGEHDGQFHLTPAGRKRLWGLIKERL
jgi:hypothetical protein